MLLSAASTTMNENGSVEILGPTLDEIWAIAHLDLVTYGGREYVPMLSFIEEGPVGTPVLYLAVPV